MAKISDLTLIAPGDVDGQETLPVVKGGEMVRLPAKPLIDVLAKPHVDLARAWAEGANPGGAGTKSARGYAEQIAGSAAKIDTAIQPGAPVSQLVETLTAKILTAAERIRVASIAASKRAAPVSGRSIAFMGRRNRVFGGFSLDGKTLDFSGNLIERVTGAMRMRSQLASRGIDLFDDNAVGLPGQKLFRQGGATIRATVGARRRLIEHLSTAGYRVFGFSAPADGSVKLPGLTAAANGVVTSGGLKTYPDGFVELAGERRRDALSTRIIRAVRGRRRRAVEMLTTEGYSVHGFTVRRTNGRLGLYLDGTLFVQLNSFGAPQFTGLTGGGAAIVKSDTYYRAGVGILPVLTDMTKWAIWGSSTANYLEDNFDTLATARGATAYPGGQGGERIEHHTARLGSHPALLNFPANTIPASGAVDLPLPAAWPVATSSPLLPFIVTVAGVRGTLRANTAGDGLSFTRSTAGTAMVTTANVPALPVDGIANRGSFSLLNLGKNSISSGRAAAEVIQITAEAYAWLSPLINRSLVMNHFIDTTTPVGSATFQRVLDVNAGLAPLFGTHLVDLYGFVCLGKTAGQLANPILNPAHAGKTIWDVTGIVPTADDLEKQVEGRKPVGLSRDGGHLSEAADQAVMWLVDQLLVQLGYYQE